MSNIIQKETEVKAERGASMVEYVLLVALIALVALTGVKFLGTSISKVFSQTGSGLNSQVGSAWTNTN